MPYKDPEKNRECIRRHYQNHKEYYRARNKRRLLEMQQWYRELKKSLQCVKCGEHHPSCIEFHHNDPAKKEMLIAYCVVRGWGKERILKEMAKCTVLCSNCHRKYHWNNSGMMQLVSIPDFESGDSTFES